MTESKRHALQDYQKTDGVRLVAPPDSSYMMKSKKMSLGKCVRRCSRNRKLPFTCRYGGFSGSIQAVNPSTVYKKRGKHVHCMQETTCSLPIVGYEGQCVDLIKAKNICAMMKQGHVTQWKNAWSVPFCISLNKT